MYATPGTNTLRCASESERNNSARTVLHDARSSARESRRYNESSSCVLARATRERCAALALCINNYVLI
ncbi:unnamed protein product [Arctia plantaginis]|uniref:Uncharacterized protein n=1 Tax=Arctia plantaginis TaxID=874455 RepID=A0A8S0Z0F2_ARCPL|nr:unnamed protein product [Arctia plantaginis]